jgi:hypothetical protein
MEVKNRLTASCHPLKYVVNYIPYRLYRHSGTTVVDVAPAATSSREGY